MSSSAYSLPNSSKSGALLAPGFRFHPTDVELVSYYLKRKVCGKPLRVDAISEIEIYRFEPWDLPCHSRLQTRDLEWYFFSSLDKKHGNGSRTNRATEQGYWKTTGKDRSIRRNSRTVGMKKTLVFHVGRAPRGKRTNWVMHEYRLEDPVSDRVGIPQGSFVLCRVFQKSGPGPKNGEQYGAPFLEEEWDDDLLIPKKEGSVDGTADIVSHVGEWGSVPWNDEVQENGCDDDNNIKYSEFFDEIGDQNFFNGSSEDANFPELYVDEFFDSTDGENNLLSEDADQYLSSMDENGNSIKLDDMVPMPTVEPCWESNGTSHQVADDDFCGEMADDGVMYYDASTDVQPPTGDGLFLEMDDLLKHDEIDTSGFETLDEFLAYFNATNDNLHHTESSYKSEGMDFVSNPSNSTSEASRALDLEPSSSTLHNPEGLFGVVDESKGNTETSIITDFPSDVTLDKSLAKHFSNMLESVTAPPAFAGDYVMEGIMKPVERNAARSTSLHVNAQMFLFSELRVAEVAKCWLPLKFADARSLIHYGIDGDSVTPKPWSGNYLYGFEEVRETPARAIPLMWQTGLSLGFLWVLFLTVSFKISSYICTR